MAEERLQKILARAGYGSRRSAETVIAAGRVTVDGSVATLGTRADPDHARIAVDGEPIAVERRELTLALNKPVGYVVTANDEAGRRTVYELLPDAPAHLRYVGRLDADTSGLLLMTTDGELAHRLSHPRYEVEKEYEAWVTGVVAAPALNALRSGVVLEDGPTQPAMIERIAGAEPPTRVRLIIHEGRKRQVRRMFEAVGHEVFRLERRRVGPITLDAVPLGKSRELTPDEMSDLRALVGLGGNA
ncbi:MAG: rRNA pseudouridine synthase [Chloroflexi bacterium]|nr:pseudouridine synthase [Chloroflexota bacterium]MQC17649.1 rRNA pseudouridine synthase [Chloroflexota bacterium]